MKRGDIVIVDYARTDPTAAARPSLIVQNDLDNSRLQKTIVVQITSNLIRANDHANLLIDENHADWAASGLQLPSVITCGNVNTVLWDDVTHRLGSLSVMTMNQIDECLKTALEIP